MHDLFKLLGVSMPTEKAEPANVFGFTHMNLDDATDDPADLLAMAQVFNDLATYAGKKAAAINHRQAGKIAEALRFEEDADEAFEQLPAWAQW